MPYNSKEKRRLNHIKNREKDNEQCRKWRNKNRSYFAKYQRSYKLKTNYNLTLEQYNSLFSKQQGKCAICGKHQVELERRLHVDHNHSCCSGNKSCGKCIRGLLCKSCNCGLGGFKDSIENLKNAIKYLE